MLTAKLILLHVLANDKAALADRTKVNSDQAYCLAQNIYHEARGESIAGQFAVAHTTLNRVKSSAYPQTVCGVVTQAVRDEHNKPIKNMCQFSWYCDEAPDYISVSKKDGKLSGNAEAFEIAATVAIMALAGSGCAIAASTIRLWE